jgi:ParB family transcriptional regulator, chromosome partitioning protein
MNKLDATSIKDFTDSLEESIESHNPGVETILSTALIDRSPYQSRKYFDAESQARLTANIKEVGILQNLVVRKTGDRYQLVAGERRWLSAQELEIDVPVKIIELSDLQARKLGLAENLQRENLNVIEGTQSILELLQIELGIETIDEVKAIILEIESNTRNETYRNVSVDVNTTELVSRIISENAKGMSVRSFYKTRIPLLNLPQIILDAILTKGMEYTKALAIFKIDDPDIQKEILNAAIENKWSLSEIKKQIKSSKSDLVESTVSGSDNSGIDESTVSEAGNNESELEPQKRVAKTFKRLQSKKSWEDPIKWKLIEKLLLDLDILLK